MKRGISTGWPSHGNVILHFVEHHDIYSMIGFASVKLDVIVQVLGLFAVIHAGHGRIALFLGAWKPIGDETVQYGTRNIIRVIVYDCL